MASWQIATGLVENSFPSQLLSLTVQFILSLSTFFEEGVKNFADVTYALYLTAMLNPRMGPSARETELVLLRLVGVV